ncbi:alpha-L-fucosidase [Anaerobacterium chartisolvens]|uniref:alpha-L-fucosidase n=1 Tax=Anaerobacterium chartisolvens TaxID=1297424 RepID=A0A369BB93_9FIRM|nr:alpha-L-fucosidase [Anaerobacterium chartisolvens]RCX18799.1 alpha-L-fucosidase [Anaerobacterium chartisolvens]
MLLPIPSQRVKNFERMGFGMFIHFGLYSQLESGEWVMNLKNIPLSQYAKLKDTFTAEDFDAEKIVLLAKRAGMKYITMGARHHEGFSLYDTKGLSNYDSVHSPAGRDLVAEFVSACRQNSIVPFLYHTTLDWYQESYKTDFNAYLEYLRKSIEILCRNYGEIGGLWFDGNWDKPDADWRLDELYGTIRKYQPEAIIVNNTGLEARGELSHPEIDSVTFEQGRPVPLNRNGMSKYVTGEMCQTMNENWGIGKRDLNYKSTSELIENLCACRKAGANYLLNTGPTAQGSIPGIQKELMETIGDWMSLNGRAIYEGKPCMIRGGHEDFALEGDDGKVYLFIYKLHVQGHPNVTLGANKSGPRAFYGVHRKVSGVRWLDNNEELAFTQDTDSGLFCFDATGYPYGENLVVRVAELY